MSFFRRLWGGHARRALEAEAAGDYDEAVRLYALADLGGDVARIHLLRARKAQGRKAQVDALRHAMAWAVKGTDTGNEIARRLADALLAGACASAAKPVSSWDIERAKEAAELLAWAGEHRKSGETLELVGDDQAAADAYAQGGEVERMEAALARHHEQERTARGVKQALEDHEVAMQGGLRADAMKALERCVGYATSDESQYRRMQRELEARRPGRTLRLKTRDSETLLVAGERLVMGRDPEAELQLEQHDISRQHAELRRDDEQVWLVDRGSRNGTHLAGLGVEGEIPLVGSGSFALGDACEIEFAVGSPEVRLRVVRGPGHGTLVRFAPAGHAFDLEPMGIRARISYDGAWWRVTTAGAPALRRHGDEVGTSRLDLLVGDEVDVGTTCFEVAK